MFRAVVGIQAYGMRLKATNFQPNSQVVRKRLGFFVILLKFPQTDPLPKKSAYCEEVTKVLYVSQVPRFFNLR